jgi:hypothetical protein
MRGGKKTAIRADQGKQKQSTWDGSGLEKRILSSIHAGALVAGGSLWQ